ncbi:tRNA (1-methyladenosine) methyltransferase catalytic subunit Gcd14 like protein [Aduncisulcus paluster]|uniref:tRNA (adenine(58)-N(1))-methyltransferase n=1 Tax=Aduncisulcus paluster TaxID=2918883 RepID=A0ABQ5K3L4_9EUKA|nr:tRNA (1-methyladenosine) methyltransferase catalytic subunit Gcd14 like protein [Aduncisulcus paluster]|eukprot:gnl/Carplike_NY0171/1496_a2037_722.p1 GENE.gnl/Carplike_NY0171/1496_a2037_722~~gnl/Carplike_NY0171/1496_a2037_722.p1  ORF type:complete len:358 (-),score=57.96 gnl/Carplike_NY0171/1496_a2037_722:32-1069(-)
MSEILFDVGISDEVYAKEGMSVILYVNPRMMFEITLKEGDCFTAQYGAFRHNDIIGKPYGSKVLSQNKKGFMILLPYFSELWSSCLETRTQIIFPSDIGAILGLLDARPGKLFAESGTGSASLTHAIADSIGLKRQCLEPSFEDKLKYGHVFTFEYHSLRADAARAELYKHGLAHSATVTQRDVYSNGLLPNELIDIDLKSNQLLSSLKESIDKGEGFYDGIFLDLPSPWLAFDHAAQAVKKGGVIVTFSPCLEQCLQNNEKAREIGLIVGKTVQILNREMDTKRSKMKAPCCFFVPSSTDGKRRWCCEELDLKPSLPPELDVFTQTRICPLQRTHTGFLTTFYK